MLEVNQIVNGCYILRHRIGEDTFSEWWQATAIFVASNFLLRFIKDEYSLDEELIKTFVENSRDCIPLVSPAILGLIEVDRHKNRFFIASYYQGHTHLKSLLAAGRTFSVEHACRLMIELATGVGMLHMHNLTFGALTSDCVAIHGFGDDIDECKLLLPGYQTFFKQIPMERSSEYVDAWGYASPEFKKGKKVDSRSDIYSLGILLFRLVAGKLPYGSKAGIKVGTQSASPANVAAALARRGIPRELITATVRALRKNPDLRQDDIVTFIEELRGVLGTRRKALSESDKSNPVADMVTLNLKNAKADSREIIKSLETVAYFHDAFWNGTSQSTSPIKTLMIGANILELEELEELESIEAGDDDAISTEAYIDYGYEAASSSKKVVVPPQVKRPPSRTIVKPVAAPAAEPVVEPLVQNPEPQVEQLTAAASKVPVAPENPGLGVHPPTLEGNTALSGSRVDQKMVPGVARPAKPAKPAKPARQPRAPKRSNLTLKDQPVPPVRIVWRQVGGYPKDIAETIITTATRAKDGHGIVKFIEDPGANDPGGQINTAIQSLHEFSLVIDLGLLGGDTALGELLEKLNAVLPEPGLKESELMEADSKEADSKESMVRCASRVAVAVSAYADRERPLILIGRGTEGITQSVHQLILELARIAPATPLCAFFFFNATSIPPWHILADMHKRWLRA